MHEDNLLATRVSVFLLAESILVAVTAALVNTVAGFTPATRPSIRDEVFGLAIAINLAGLVLTLTFWYVFNINYQGVQVLTRRLQGLDSIYSRLSDDRATKRADHWYFNIVFRKKGANWVVNNILPLIFLFLWCIIAAFSAAIFASR